MNAACLRRLLVAHKRHLDNLPVPVPAPADHLPPSAVPGECSFPNTGIFATPCLPPLSSNPIGNRGSRPELRNPGHQAPVESGSSLLNKTITLSCHVEKEVAFVGQMSAALLMRALFHRYLPRLPCNTRTPTVLPRDFSCSATWTWCRRSGERAAQTITSLVSQSTRLAQQHKSSKHKHSYSLPWYDPKLTGGSCPVSHSMSKKCLNDCVGLPLHSSWASFST